MFGHGTQGLFPMDQQNRQRLQVIVGQFRQHIPRNGIFLECFSITHQPKTLQPCRYGIIHDQAALSMNGAMPKKALTTKQFPLAGGLAVIDNSSP
jgi:hypothetical protein